MINNTRWFSFSDGLELLQHICQLQAGHTVIVQNIDHQGDVDDSWQFDAQGTRTAVMQARQLVERFTELDQDGSNWYVLNDIGKIVVRGVLKAHACWVLELAAGLRTLSFSAPISKSEAASALGSLGYALGQRIELQQVALECA
jgi:hypothetical protein